MKKISRLTAEIPAVTAAPVIREKLAAEKIRVQAAQAVRETTLRQAEPQAP